MSDVEAIFQSHARDVYRYAWRRLDPNDRAGRAEEITAEVFALAWRRRAELPDPPLPWLYAAARRILANARRTHARPAVAVAVFEALDPADEVTEAEVLAAAWRSLSERDQEILRLSAWEGLSGSALASALEMSEAAAYTALSRARARFLTASKGV